MSEMKYRYLYLSTKKQVHFLSVYVYNLMLILILRTRNINVIKILKLFANIDSSRILYLIKVLHVLFSIIWIIHIHLSLNDEPSELEFLHLFFKVSLNFLAHIIAWPHAWWSNHTHNYSVFIWLRQGLSVWKVFYGAQQSPMILLFMHKLRQTMEWL